MKIDRIVQVANRLRETQFFDVELIDRITIKLETEWKKLYTAVERRSTMLDASVSFHRSSEKVYVSFLLDFLGWHFENGEFWTLSERQKNSVILN